MIFKIYNCDFGVKIGGVNYDFPQVAELTIETTLRNRLTRGSNATDKVGLTYRDGLKDPARWTIPILAMTAALKSVLDIAFANQQRLEVYCIDRATGSMKMARNAILSNEPQQLTIDETAESMNVSLEFESFDSTETHKE